MKTTSKCNTPCKNTRDQEGFVWCYPYITIFELIFTIFRSTLTLWTSGVRDAHTHTHSDGPTGRHASRVSRKSRMNASLSTLNADGEATSLQEAPRQIQPAPRLCLRACVYSIAINRQLAEGWYPSPVTIPSWLSSTNGASAVANE